MTDEEYLFTSDSFDKKRTARGAHYRVNHGGRVKTPSNFLTKKELQKMNGECKSYRLNEPMTWAEFMVLPDDLKASYINAIRIRFGASDSEIFKMFGVEQRKGSYEFQKMGLGRGRNCERLRFSADAWAKWKAGIKDEIEVETEDCIHNARALEPTAPVEPIVERLPTTKNRIYPLRGHMTLRGTAAEIGEVLAEMLGGGTLMVSLEWEVEE